MEVVAGRAGQFQRLPEAVLSSVASSLRSSRGVEKGLHNSVGVRCVQLPMESERRVSDTPEVGVAGDA